MLLDAIVNSMNRSSRHQNHHFSCMCLPVLGRWALKECQIKYCMNISVCQVMNLIIISVISELKVNRKQKPTNADLLWTVMVPIDKHPESERSLDVCQT